MKYQDGGRMHSSQSLQQQLERLHYEQIPQGSPTSWEVAAGARQASIESLQGSKSLWCKFRMAFVVDADNVAGSVNSC